MILSPFFWCTSWLKITIMIFHFAPIASTLSTSKEFLHWEWRDCMHFYCVMECTHEIFAGVFFLCVFFFLIFTLLLTVSQHKTCDVYIFLCIKRKYKSRRQILKYWITSIFHNLVFWQLFACFPQNYGLCVCPWRLVHTDKEEIKELSSCGLHFFITIATWPII